MLTVLDVETTMIKTLNGKYDPSPFNPKNRLVSVGIKTEKEFPYLCLYHSEHPIDKQAAEIIKKFLDEATILVAHNAKFELMWLRASGFDFRKPILDTMIIEYVMARGLKIPLDLDSCCERRKVEGKDAEGKKLLKSGVSPENIPWDVLEKYGRQDLVSTEKLALKHIEMLGGQKALDYLIDGSFRTFTDHKDDA